MPDPLGLSLRAAFSNARRISTRTVSRGQRVKGISSPSRYVTEVSFCSLSFQDAHPPCAKHARARIVSSFRGCAIIDIPRSFSSALEIFEYLDAQANILHVAILCKEVQKVINLKEREREVYLNYRRSCGDVFFIVECARSLPESRSDKKGTRSVTPLPVCPSHAP